MYICWGEANSLLHLISIINIFNNKNVTCNFKTNPHESQV